MTGSVEARKLQARSTSLAASMRALIGLIPGGVTAVMQSLR